MASQALVIYNPDQEDQERDRPERRGSRTRHDVLSRMSESASKLLEPMSAMRHSKKEGGTATKGTGRSEKDGRTKRMQLRNLAGTINKSRRLQRKGTKAIPQRKFFKGQEVYYRASRDGNGGVAKVIIKSVHMDSNLEPYYTVRFSNGREKQTDHKHLSSLEEELTDQLSSDDGRGGLSKSESTRTSGTSDTSPDSSVQSSADGVAKFMKGQRAYYRSHGKVAKITVLEVHHDHDQEAYYTIQLADGKEKQTDNSHLASLMELSSEELSTLMDEQERKVKRSQSRKTKEKSSGMVPSAVDTTRSKLEPKSEKNNAKTSRFVKGNLASYKSQGILSKVVVMEVHFDDDLEPYYTITLPDGREKQTDDAHLLPRDYQEEVSSNALVVRNDAEVVSDTSPEEDPAQDPVSRGSSPSSSLTEGSAKKVTSSANESPPGRFGQFSIGQEAYYQSSRLGVIKVKIESKLFDEKLVPYYVVALPDGTKKQVYGNRLASRMEQVKRYSDESRTSRRGSGRSRASSRAPSRDPESSTRPRRRSRSRVRSERDPEGARPRRSRSRKARARSKSTVRSASRTRSRSAVHRSYAPQDGEERRARMQRRHTAAVLSRPSADGEKGKTRGPRDEDRGRMQRRQGHYMPSSIESRPMQPEHTGHQPRGMVRSSSTRRTRVEREERQ